MYSYIRVLRQVLKQLKVRKNGQQKTCHTYVLQIVHWKIWTIYRLHKMSINQ